MSNNDTTTTPTPVDKYAGKRCLVVSREDLTAACRILINPNAGGELFHGFTGKNATELLTVLLSRAKFADQGPAEKDPSLKQLIPYCVVHTVDSILSYSRAKAGTEARLHDKRSIGVGGHIEPEDMGPDESITLSGLVSSLYREVAEEVGISESGIIDLTLAGFVNNDADEVGSVHLGVIFYVTVASTALGDIEPHLRDVRWEDPNDLLPGGSQYDCLEAWSQMVAQSGMPSSDQMLNRSVREGAMSQGVIRSADSVIGHFRESHRRTADLTGGPAPIGLIDRKFVFHAVNPVNGHTYTQDDAIILCAKDAATPAALNAYVEWCRSNNLVDDEHCWSMDQALQRVVAFQEARGGGRIPDTVGAELDRCLDPVDAEPAAPTRPAYQQRVIDEARELGDRRTKLEAFLTGEASAKISTEERGRMAEQMLHMGRYLAVLDARIAAFPAA